MDKKLFLLSSLLLSTLIWAEYYSFETGEEIKKNDWILLDEILTKDKGGNVLGTAYKYCVITDIVDETKKTPSAYSNREEPHPLNAVGYVWFVLSGPRRTGFLLSGGQLGVEVPAGAAGFPAGAAGFPASSMGL